MHVLRKLNSSEKSESRLYDHFDRFSKSSYSISRSVSISENDFHGYSSSETESTFGDFMLPRKTKNAHSIISTYDLIDGGVYCDFDECFSLINDCKFKTNEHFLGSIECPLSEVKTFNSKVGKIDSKTDAQSVSSNNRSVSKKQIRTIRNLVYSESTDSKRTSFSDTKFENFEKKKIKFSKNQKKQIKNSNKIEKTKSEEVKNKTKKQKLNPKKKNSKSNKLDFEIKICFKESS